MRFNLFTGKDKQSYGYCNTRKVFQKSIFGRGCIKQTNLLRYICKCKKKSCGNSYFYVIYIKIFYAFSRNYKVSYN